MNIHADISSVQTIGVVVPPGSSELRGAEDVMQLHNLTVGEDRVKNAAKGTGLGAAVGAFAGVTTGAIIGCTAGGPLAVPCMGLVVVAGAILGGTTGAVAGATFDTQEQIDTAPVHLYEVNQVLPDLKRDYLDSSVLQKRALRIVRAQGTAIYFVPAAWNGERYAPSDAAAYTTETRGVNLVLTAMSVSLSGKAEDDPRLFIDMGMQWALTRYNLETQNDEVWDEMSSTYASGQRHLSEWLDDDGALLKAEVNRGIEESMTNAFSDLPRMVGQENAADRMDRF